MDRSGDPWPKGDPLGAMDPPTDEEFEREMDLIDQRFERLRTQRDTARSERDAALIEVNRWRELAVRQRAHINKRWAELCAAEQRIADLMGEEKADNLVDELQACDGRWDMTETIKAWVESGAR